MMKKINETMNHMTVTAYVKGNQMKNKVADILRRKEGRKLLSINNLFNNRLVLTGH